MTKPKLLLIGYRAYGDWLYTAPILPLLFEKYDVYLEANFKGQELFEEDPRFTEKNFWIYEVLPESEFGPGAAVREKEAIERIKPDLVMNLNGTLEFACIARKEQPQFYAPVGDRRVIFGSQGFYDAIFRRCDIPIPNPLETEGLWYPAHILEWGEKVSRKYKDNFLVMLCVNGSSVHKQFRNWRAVTEKILCEYPEAMIFLVGDSAGTLGGFKHERVIPTFFPSLPFKQTALLAKHMDIVIGPETGIMVAAGMWGTPKVMLCSASSVYQVAQYQRNDFSIQLPVACSPCHLSVYELDDCENVIKEGEERMPACVRQMPEDQIMERVSYVHRNLRRRIP